ncbi:MAG: transglutaminase family protein [Myxococcales bacterium]|nr:MAG: transglutaminase family protein [Myxococcales bacterium]
MKIQAGCDIQLSAPSPAPLVAMLRPRSGAAQWIISERYAFEPFVQAVEYVDSFGNLCQRMTAPAGSFRIHTEVLMEVSEAIAVDPGGGPTPIEDLPDYALQFLLPSRYCPSDTLENVARDVVSGAKPGYDQVDAIREFIRRNIEYRSGSSNGSTSAVDTLRDKAGVCRDFSHVGLSLCRALRIPARMVVGYLLGLKPMDLHAWFEAFVGGRWYAFDATQPEPRGGRIPIAYGRDAADVALITELGPLKTDSMHVWVREVESAGLAG